MWCHGDETDSVECAPGRTEKRPFRLSQPLDLQSIVLAAYLPGTSMLFRHINQGLLPPRAVEVDLF